MLGEDPGGESSIPMTDGAHGNLGTLLGKAWEGEGTAVISVLLTPPLPPQQLTSLYRQLDITPGLLWKDLARITDPAPTTRTGADDREKNSD